MLSTAIAIFFITCCVVGIVDQIRVAVRATGSARPDETRPEAIAAAMVLFITAAFVAANEFL